MNHDPILKEELAQWRGDVESLLNRQQRFAQMLVEDFDRLITTAEAEIQLRNAVFDLCGHLPGLSDEELLANIKNELESRRVDSEQLQRMSRAIVAILPHAKTNFGSEGDHAEALLSLLGPKLNSNAA